MKFLHSIYLCKICDTLKPIPQNPRIFTSLSEFPKKTSSIVLYYQTFNRSKKRFMHNSIKLSLIILILFLFNPKLDAANINLNSSMSKDTIPIPLAQKKDKLLSKHGDQRHDPYYWMKDRDNPEVRNYLEAENAYTTSVLQDTEELQEEIYQEIIARINPDDIGVPYELNGYIYLTKYEKDKEYPIHLRKLIGHDDEDYQTIIDVNELAEGHDYYQINSMAISPDNKWLAYGVDTVSRRIYTIHFKNLETGETLDETIENTTGTCTWAADNKTVYFSSKDETLRPDKIWSYVLGNPDSKTLIYEEKDSTFITYVYKSKSREYIIIGSYSTLAQEYRILKADDVGGEFKVFQERKRNLEYDISHAGGDMFYIVTNKEAQNFRLMQCSVKNTDEEAWEEVIPHRTDVFLEGIDVFKDYIVLSERKNGLTAIRVVSRLDPEIDYYLDTNDAVYVQGTAYNREFTASKVTTFYQSMVQPPIYYSYDMKSGSREVLQEKEYPTYDKSLYTTERIWATADDGARVPLSLVYKKGLKLDGNNPTLLYGYGSYGVSVDPGFASSFVSLLDRGFIFARAHIRGGSEMGRQWYDQGKLMHKKNTFTDFIACANALIDKQYTDSDKLTAMGGSAGGLLMGAVINLEPELFSAVIAAVPFVDVVTTMLDESIPLTTGEYDEWGNPNEKEAYEYIKSYSPYDNIKKVKYPALLVTTGFHDSQVQYWEPAKWVAKIRDFNSGDRPVLLRTNMDTGHSGTTGRYKAQKETAMEFAFLIKMLNLDN